MSKVRVLLADDHAIVRAGLRLLLESQPDMEVVGEAADGSDALAKARALKPDVAVLDISMPGTSGLEAIQQLKREIPSTHVLVLTMHENERFFFQAISAGAAGYVVKGAQPADLVAAIRAVAQGQAYLYPSVARQLVDDYLRRVQAGEERDSYEGLTEREREIVRCLAQGMTGRQIAEVLFLSVHTVERHRANIMAKLKLHTRAELIKYAIRKGLIDVTD